MITMYSPGIISAVVSSAIVWLAQSREIPFYGHATPRETISLITQVDTGKTSPDTLAVQLSTITTDTGAFAPGHRDFSRYTTIGLCLTAARNTRVRLHRSLAAQAIGDTLVYDTVGIGGVSPVARRCGARFTGATTPPHDLQQAFELALDEQDAPFAQEVLAQLVARAATPAARDAAWESGLDAYLHVGWRAQAETLMAHVDAEGQSAWQARLAMHRDLAYALQFTDADTGQWRAEIQKRLVLADSMPRGMEQLAYDVIRESYANLLGEAMQSHSDTVHGLAILAQRALSRFKDIPAVTQGGGDLWHPWQTYSIDQVIDSLTHKMVRYHRRGGGGKAPHLQADYWFPAPGQPKSDTVRPVPGKVNLICQGGIISNDPNAIRIDDRPGHRGSDFAIMEQIRRWLERYGAQNLVVTIVREAAGYTGIAVTDWPYWYLFQTSAQEAQAWRWYTQDYEQMPVTVAVQVRHDQWLPQPDGRRLYESKVQFNEFWRHDPDYVSQVQRDPSTAIDSLYGVRPGEMSGTCAIIDRDGTIWHTSMEDDPLPNTDGALRMLFHGRGPASPRTAGNLQAVLDETSPFKSGQSPHLHAGSLP